MKSNSVRFTCKFCPCFDESAGFIYEHGKARADSPDSLDKGGGETIGNIHWLGLSVLTGFDSDSIFTLKESG